MNHIITPANILQHELIGLPVAITKTTYKSMPDKEAKVVDETQKMLALRFGKDAKKWIPKESSDFVFTLPDGRRLTVKGELLLGNPEDRIKKKLPKKWDVLK